MMVGVSTKECTEEGARELFFPTSRTAGFVGSCFFVLRFLASSVLLLSSLLSQLLSINSSLPTCLYQLSSIQIDLYQLISVKPISIHCLYQLTVTTCKH